MSVTASLDIRFFASDLDASLSDFVEAAGRAPLVERRRGVRRPFCRPATILVDGAGASLVGFTRDLSLDGLGLLHTVPLTCGKAIVGVRTHGGRTVAIRCEILWCLPCRAGRYQSGTRFLHLAAD